MTSIHTLKNMPHKRQFCIVIAKNTFYWIISVNIHWNAIKDSWKSLFTSTLWNLYHILVVKYKSHEKKIGWKINSFYYKLSVIIDHCFLQHLKCKYWRGGAKYWLPFCRHCSLKKPRVVLHYARLVFGNINENKNVVTIGIFNYCQCRLK